MSRIFEMNIKSTRSDRRNMGNDLCRCQDLADEVTKKTEIGLSSITSIDK